MIAVDSPPVESSEKKGKIRSLAKFLYALPVMLSLGGNGTHASVNPTEPIDVLEQMSHQPKAIDDKARQQVKPLPYIGLASMARLVTVILIYFLYFFDIHAFHLICVLVNGCNLDLFLTFMLLE